MEERLSFFGGGGEGWGVGSEGWFGTDENISRVKISRVCHL